MEETYQVDLSSVLRSLESKEYHRAQLDLLAEVVLAHLCGGDSSEYMVQQIPIAH
jgi:hypothetical protein